MGLVPSLRMFCNSVSVTVKPNFSASPSTNLLETKVFHTWSRICVICSSGKLSSPLCILMTSVYSSTSFWNSCTLIFSPNTSPTCILLSLLVASQERMNSSAINAKRPRPIIHIRMVPFFLIDPNAAIIYR